MGDFGEIFDGIGDIFDDFEQTCVDFGRGIGDFGGIFGDLSGTMGDFEDVIGDFEDAIGDFGGTRGGETLVIGDSSFGDDWTGDLGGEEECGPMGRGEEGFDRYGTGGCEKVSLGAAALGRAGFCQFDSAAGVGDEIGE